MATKTSRKRKIGSIGYTGDIRIKKGGRVIHNEFEMLERLAAAKSWAVIEHGRLYSTTPNFAATPTGVLDYFGLKFLIFPTFT